MAMPVGIAELKAAPVDDSSEFVGVLKSRRSSAIQPQAEGFLTKILVKSGDKVSAGTPLFEIDNTPQQAVVAGLESMRAAREADVAFARSQLERAKKLLDVGASSQQEFDQATNAARTAEAQLKALDEQIRQRRRQSWPTTRCVRRSPASSATFRCASGDRVSKTTELTTIDDNSGLEIYINVSRSQQASKLRTGLPVNIVDETGQTIADRAAELRVRLGRREHADGAREGAAQPSGIPRRAVRARADRLEHRAGARDSADGRDADQRAVLRVRRRARRRAAWSPSSAPCKLGRDGRTELRRAGRRQGRRAHRRVRHPEDRQTACPCRPLPPDLRHEATGVARVRRRRRGRPLGAVATVHHAAGPGDGLLAPDHARGRDRHSDAARSRVFRS